MKTTIIRFIGASLKYYYLHYRERGFVTWLQKLFLKTQNPLIFVIQLSTWDSTPENQCLDILFAGRCPAGFKLIHYEYFGEGTDVATRELGQAKNLVERFFSKTSDQEKLFVYVGYDHVREKQNAARNIYMAQRLKELTGIDPLTINQYWLRPSRYYQYGQYCHG